MVTKKKGEKSETKSPSKIGKLKLGKETIKDLRPGQLKQIKGGGTMESRRASCSCGGAC